ncbi:MAG TPA: glutathione S-transferase family protein [Solirubrobacterales bacterium]|nr:glutathione S-transferase family protein [Solirubrobacterales bacterium]
MEARLYVFPGSHAAMIGRLLLEHKGIDYSRVDLMPVFAKPIVRALGFPGTTVPALKLDGRRVQGTRSISRELDRIQPDPPLFPADPEARGAVEEAERFGDEELQPLFRQIPYWAYRQDLSPLRSYAEGAKLGIPIGLAIRTARPIIWLASRLNDAGDENVRRDLAALPGLLQRVDELIAAGVLDGEQLNAADLQIAATVRLAMTFDDLRPAIEGRPAGRLAMRVAPHYPGHTPPVLPPAWLQPLRSTAAAA